MTAPRADRERRWIDLDKETMEGGGVISVELVTAVLNKHPAVGAVSGNRARHKRPRLVA